MGTSLADRKLYYRRYNLSFIVQNSVTIGKPIIGVSANYRLSALGFLSSAEVAGSGNTNLGLRDQRLALHWLQENIGAFGGDHSKVTIWGESAGAFDVGSQLLAYGGRDDKLFRAAIMESGSPIAIKAQNGTQSYQPLYDQIVQQVGCYNEIDTLQCLRTVPISQLNNVIKNAPYNTSFEPTIDGDFIEKFTSVQLADGEFVHVPIISGFNTDEGTLFAPYGINDDAGFLHWLESTFITNLFLCPGFKQGAFIRPIPPSTTWQSKAPQVIQSMTSSSLHALCYSSLNSCASLLVVE